MRLGVFISTTTNINVDEIEQVQKPVQPMFLGSLMLGSLKAKEEQVSIPCSLIQTTQDLVFVGTTRGHVFVIDIDSRQLIESGQPPMTNDDQSCHSRGVYTMVSLSIHRKHPAIWSTSSIEHCVDFTSLMLSQKSKSHMHLFQPPQLLYYHENTHFTATFHPVILKPKSRLQSIDWMYVSDFAKQTFTARPF